MALLKMGYLSIDELNPLPGVPPAERLLKGPVAIIECAQEIPCNPCVDACDRGAIEIEGSITNLPRLDGDDCIGCGLCVAACPGQAIFIVDMTYSETEASVQIPYEYYPLPQKGEIVDGLNRSGQSVCDATVLRVLHPKRYDRTAVVTLIVPKEFAMEVRCLNLRREEHAA